MPQHHFRSDAIRRHAAKNNLNYTTAARELETRDAIEAADAIDYDPAFDGAIHDSQLHPGVARATGLLTGVGADCFDLAVPDPTAEGGPDGRLAVIARPDIYRGEPALVIEAVAITETHHRLPGLWLNAWSIVLWEKGWRYDIGDFDTTNWHVRIAPVPNRPSAPATVTVANNSYTLFEGPALLPPGWIARANHTPDGIWVIAGPCSGSLMPADLDDDTVDDMLATADLVHTRIRVTVTNPEGETA